MSLGVGFFGCWLLCMEYSGVILYSVFFGVVVAFFFPEVCHPFNKYHVDRYGSTIIKDSSLNSEEYSGGSQGSQALCMGNFCPANIPLPSYTFGFGLGHNTHTKIIPIVNLLHALHTQHPLIKSIDSQIPQLGNSGALQTAVETSREVSWFIL